MTNNVRVYGLENSIRVAKFPMTVDIDKVTDETTKTTNNLALEPPGTAHNNFLCGIVVQFDLTATNKFWVEFERYHFADIVSSQSTMHRITRFDIKNSYIEYTNPKVIEIMKNLVEEYNNIENKQSKEAKEKYLEILYTNPAGFQLTAGITTNYLQLKTMYQQRKNHRLPEWREFCKFLETLPHSEWITDKKVDEMAEFAKRLP